SLAAQTVELHVEAQHGDIGRDHTRKERRDDPDPEHAARDTALALRDARSRAQWSGCLLGPGDGGPGSHGLGLYSHAESRGRRSRVSRRLSGVRADRLPRGRAELRSLAAHADREVGRTLAAAFAIAHEALDDPILERMEADHREPATGPQHRERGRQRGLEGAELVVDGNPERLEHALGGMTVSKAGRSRNRRLDRLDEVARPLERILLPAPDDRLRDLPRVPLLAVTLENRC